MKKVGIITYHFAINYGAMLQCYALLTAVQNLENESKVINYISDNQFDNNKLYRSKGIKNWVKNIVLLPFHNVRSARQKHVEEFQTHYLRTDARLRTIDNLKKYVDNEKFDVLISGSDQVWNPHIDDFDQAFFYPINTQAKKVGYAVSIGQALKADLIPYQKWIREFDVITVREKSSCALISEIAKKTVRDVVDPVFMLTKEQWDRVIPRLDKKSKYIICYFVKKNELDRKVKIARKMAKEMGIPLIMISPRITKNNFIYTVVSNAGPLEFLAYLKNAEFVCTDSFHGTVFSVILNKQFLTLERIEEKNDSRKTDILNRLNLIDRVQYIDAPIKKRKEIDYSLVRPTIEQIREEAIKILSGMIG